MRISQHIVDLFDLGDKSSIRLTLQGFDSERDIIVTVREITGKLVARIEKIEDLLI